MSQWWSGQMGVERRRVLGVAPLLALAWLELAACAGKSDGQKSSGGTSPSAGSANSGFGGSGGGNAGSAGSVTSGSAGSAPSGCEYNGVRHELGESFGACNECVCTKTGGVDCGMGCGPGGRGGSMNSGGGRAGTLSSGTGGGPEGGSPTTGGAGGASTGGTSAGAGTTGGLGGNVGTGGEPTTVREDCNLQEGELCVVGTPRGGGHELTVGMPMLFTIQAAGCLSSSCTELASADCNYIGSPHDFYVNGFFCVNVTEGGACTGDCGGTPDMTCDLDQTLEEGEYMVHLGNGGATLRFTVPGVIAEEDRCTHPLTF
ncbi:MAG TPA: hypothetical protein VNN72_23300 [Polyangiaceae bacterium]|nr:hypothetical protein [Polyangiaceae bacterium]